MTDFKIRFLGTASAVPTEERGLSCALVNYENELAMFDCGEGAQRAAMKAGIGFNRSFSIFITHMHGDHVVGLLGLLQTLAMHRREKDLWVFGPEGISEFILVNKKILNFGLTYNVLVKTVRKGKIFDSKSFRVFAERSLHSTLSYSYVFEEKEKPGKFNTAAALRLGVPEGPLWSRLQRGEKVKSPKNGRAVRPEQVLGPSRRGRRVGFSGDTRPSPGLEKFFKGCDVIVFDSTYGDVHQKNAVENMHSTSREAARLAKRAGATQLILTHFSGRYRDVSELVEQAREVFPNTIAASDQMVYDLSTMS